MRLPQQRLVLHLSTQTNLRNTKSSTPEPKHLFTHGQKGDVPCQDQTPPVHRVVLRSLPCLPTTPQLRRFQDLPRLRASKSMHGTSVSSAQKMYV
ncbi:hypothetical protein Mapa_003821 [Marchantia paleacea]|nr:hypothetical protein Mapa_003821 [Marchantia paleacea]